MFIFFFGAFICVAGIVLLLMQKEFPNALAKTQANDSSTPGEANSDKISEWSAATPASAVVAASDPFADANTSVVRNPVNVAPSVPVAGKDEKDTAPIVVERMNWYDEELHVFVRKMFKPR
jgi:hypothetical protein